jgi:hypothetical protein
MTHLLQRINHQLAAQVAPQPLDDIKPKQSPPFNPQYIEKHPSRSSFSVIAKVSFFLSWFCVNKKEENLLLKPPLFSSCRKPTQKKNQKLSLCAASLSSSGETHGQKCFKLSLSLTGCNSSSLSLSRLQQIKKTEKRRKINLSLNSLFLYWLSSKRKGKSFPFYSLSAGSC